MHDIAIHEKLLASLLSTSLDAPCVHLDPGILNSSSSCSLIVVLVRG